MTRLLGLASLLAACLVAGPVLAQDLYKPGAWSSLASDLKATAVGDTLTVLVIENSTGANTTQKGSRKGSSVGGQLAYGDSYSEQARLALDGTTEGVGQTGRSGRMVAQISVSVDEVLPNGDLRVSGEHSLKINGETTKIRIKGRVRRVDIGPDNTVTSSRLADAAIDYDGSGFITRSAKPGVISQVFNWLGLM